MSAESPDVEPTPTTGPLHVRARLMNPFVWAFLAMLGALTGFALTAQYPVGLFVFVFLVSGAASALSPAIQTRLMDVAGDSQSIAAAINHSALNIGNATGAWVGGLVIAAGLGYTAPAAAGAVLALAGLAVLTVSVLLQKRG